MDYIQAMRYLPYNTYLKEFSRQLRKNSTRGEVMLWNALKAGKIKGYTFNRQKPLGNYIADFYCKTLKLVVEIDGSSHNSPEAAAKDRLKENYLISRGLTVLRFKEQEAVYSRAQVVQAICTYIEDLEKEMILQTRSRSSGEQQTQPSPFG